MIFNFDLTPSVTSVYNKELISAYEHRYHMSSNSIRYKFPELEIDLFLKNFSNLPDYVDGEIKVRITEKYINRLDLISWEYYKTPELWWLIMAVNDIINPFEVEVNSFVRILPLNYVEYNLLRYNQ